jgi:hypothetical protein
VAFTKGVGRDRANLIVVAIAGTYDSPHIWFMDGPARRRRNPDLQRFAATDCVARETLRKHDCRFLH